MLTYYRVDDVNKKVLKQVVKILWGCQKLLDQEIKTKTTEQVNKK